MIWDIGVYLYVLAIPTILFYVTYDCLKRIANKQFSEYRALSRQFNSIALDALAGTPDYDSLKQLSDEMEKYKI